MTSTPSPAPAPIALSDSDLLDKLNELEFVAWYGAKPVRTPAENAVLIAAHREASVRAAVAPYEELVRRLRHALTSAEWALRRSGLPPGCLALGNADAATQALNLTLADCVGSPPARAEGVPSSS